MSQPILLGIAVNLGIGVDNLTLDEALELTPKIVDLVQDIQDQRGEHTPLAVVHNLDPQPDDEGSDQ